MKNWLSIPLCSFFLISQASVYAQSAPEAPPSLPPDQGIWQTVIMISLALVFFYLILWRPEQKRRKEAEKQREGIKKGDKVTAMGIIGTVVKVQERSVVLRMIDGSKIEMLKMAISEIIPGTEEDKIEEELSSKK